MRIVNLDAGSYLCQTSVKALSAAEKEKKYKYIHTCLEHRHNFTPMVYSVDRNPGAEAVAVQQCLAYMKQEYLKMCSFVRSRMPLAVVISNTLLFCGTRDIFARDLIWRIG